MTPYSRLTTYEPSSDSAQELVVLSAVAVCAACVRRDTGSCASVGVETECRLALTLWVTFFFGQERASLICLLGRQNVAPLLFSFLVLHLLA